MYWEYFGFEENPFSISPDPRYLYMSKRHQEALAHLVYGIGEAGGFVLLSGEVGTGKTTICRSLIEQLPDNVDLAFVLNPRLNEIELLATICDEMAVSYPRPDPSLKVLVDRLNEHLLRAHAIGRRPVLLIDEAQNLEPSVLEQIRLLTNLETNKHKLLQIVLIGQPELNDLLARPDLRQLDQRITARYHLRPLTIQETGGYIRHRLQVGGAPTDIFTDGAIRAVFRASGGIPRLINTLCDRCLLGAYAENKRRVDAKLVKGAAKEVLSRHAKSKSRLAIPVLFAAAAAASAFLLLDPLGLNPPGTVMSVAETEQANNDTVTQGPPATISEQNTAAADIADGATVTPGLELGDVAAAEISDEPVPDGLAEIADEPDDRSVAAPSDPPVVAEADAYPLPPPPPPVEAGTSARESDTAIPLSLRPPVSPPSSRPAEVIAVSDPAVALSDTDNDAAVVVPDEGAGELQQTTVDQEVIGGAGAEPPTTGDASVPPAMTNEQGAPNSITLPAALPDVLPPPAADTALEPQASVELAELTLQTDVNDPARNAHTTSSLEDVLAHANSAGDLEAALHTLFAAWEHEYAKLKGLSPCKKARYANLRCLQGQGTWHELKVANRPAIITLSAGDAESHYGVLTRLDDEQAELVLGNGATVETNIGALSRLWTGDYLLLWRPPAKFSREMKLGLRGEDVLWLRERLSILGWDTSGTADDLSYDDALQEAVRRFQRRRGLAVDGVAGPRTILQVNAALGTADAPTIQ